MGSIQLYKPPGAGLVSESVFYVEASGNDTTGDGTPGNPFATAQKAFDESAALAVACLIHLGVGSFGNINCPSGWPFRIGISGKGPGVSKVGTVTGAGQNIFIASDKSVSFAIINATGADGSAGADGTSGDPPTDGYAGTNGSNGGTVRLHGVYATSVLANGGIGGNGGGGGNGENTNGGSGGQGGNGGTAGAIYAYGSTVQTCEAVGGAFGLGGGAGGSSTADPGNPGADGSVGSDGNIDLDDCQVQDVVSGNATFSRVSYQNAATVSGVFGDNGGSALSATFYKFW